MQFCSDQTCGAATLMLDHVLSGDVTTVASFHRRESGNRVDWELKILTINNTAGESLTGSWFS